VAEIFDSPKFRYFLYIIYYATLSRIILWAHFTLNGQSDGKKGRVLNYIYGVAILGPIVCSKQNPATL
jgi:hypothetical protein